MRIKANSGSDTISEDRLFPAVRHLNESLAKEIRVLALRGTMGDYRGTIKGTIKVRI